MAKVIGLDQERRKLVVRAPKEASSPYWDFVLQVEGEDPITIHRAFTDRDPTDVVRGVQFPLYQHVSSNWLDHNWPRLQKSIVEAIQELAREVRFEK